MSSVENVEELADGNIVRMYKHDAEDQSLIFREAWIELASAEDPNNYFVVNHGKVGHLSDSDEAQVETEEEVRGLLAAFEEQCLADEYKVLERSEQSTVVAQFALKNDRVTDRDKYLREKAVEAITAHLAWRGSGVVEKSEFAKGERGTGKLNIYVLSPDAARAVANIKVAIREAKLDFTKLSIATAPADSLGELRAKHSPNGGTAFSL